MRGKGTKLGQGERDLEGERAIFGIIMSGIITIFGIRDCFIREKFVAPIFQDRIVEWVEIVILKEKK